MDNDGVRVLLIKDVLHKHEKDVRLQEYVGNDVELLEIGDGNLNDVFRAINRKTDSSVIVKHAPNFIKCLGPDFPLSAVRSQTEFSSYQHFHRLCEGSVPRPILYDQDSHTMFMEDLRGHVILRTELMAGHVDVSAAESVCARLALVHRATHVRSISEEQFDALCATFSDSTLVELTRRFVFEQPYVENCSENVVHERVKESARKEVYEAPVVLDNIHALTHIFLTRKECLLHGDLHTGSIMVSGPDAKMIDNEFSMMGAAAFDLGMLLANYMFSFHAHILTPEDNDQHRRVAFRLLDAWGAMVQKYLSVMVLMGDHYNTFMHEVAGFAGIEMLRRVLGTAHVQDIQNNASAELESMHSGVRLVRAYQRITDIHQLLNIALMLT